MAQKLRAIERFLQQYWKVDDVFYSLQVSISDEDKRSIAAKVKKLRAGVEKLEALLPAVLAEK